MARPRKKPGYDREAEIAELIAEAVALFDIPYDDREIRPENAPTIKSVAEKMGTTTLRIRKFLISANMYSSAISRRVQELDAAGENVESIIKLTGLGKASVYSYLPLKKGAYKLPEPTLYSEQAARYRNRKRAVSELLEHLDCSDELDCLWRTVIAFETYPFTAASQGKGNSSSIKFKYTVRRTDESSGLDYSGQCVEGYGNELWISGREKSITRSTVDLAYRNGRAEQERCGCVSNPKNLQVLGAGFYLYAMFIRFGVITAG